MSMSRSIEKENSFREGVIYGARMVNNSMPDSQMKNVIEFYIEQGLKPWHLHCEPETEPPDLMQWLYFYFPSMKDND